MAFAPYGSRWRALRKLCALHLFSAKALDDLRGVREGEVALMVREFARYHRQGPAVALGQVANVCATNTLARATVGRRVFAVDGGEEAREFKDMVVELMQLAGVFNVGDFVPALAWLDPQGVVGKMKRLHRRYDDMMNGIIRERKAAGEGKDLLSVMLARMREQQPLADGEDSRINETDIKALLLVSFPFSRAHTITALELEWTRLPAVTATCIILLLLQKWTPTCWSWSSWSLVYDIPLLFSHGIMDACTFCGTHRDNRISSRRGRTPRPARWSGRWPS
jgi:flavonoid 3'-monooxygenase